jgi:4-amino-4-deoxy-L-arabinose transferase-like glycosyltransferase
LLILAYGAALFLFPMEPDSAQYASIAREMADGGSWLRVQHRGEDYLDKPPWLFWVAALFFKVLGASAFTWHLASVPALVMLGVGLRRFFRQWGVAPQALGTLVLLTFSAPATALMFSDLRCELWLTTFCVWAWWSGTAWLHTSRPVYLGASGFFLGGALLSKSMAGLLFVVPVWVAFALRHKLPWARFIHLTAGSAFLALLLLTPFLWGLWQAFGSYGLRFFFWTQTFGRITGESAWHNNPDPFFLWHTALWSWTPAVWGLLWVGFTALRTRRAPVLDYYALGPLVIILTALSFSRYQLPHYGYPLVPLAALSLGKALDQNVQQLRKILSFFAGAIMIGLTGLCVLFWDTIPIYSRWLIPALIIGLAGVVWFKRSYPNSPSFALFSAGSFLLLNAAFYPALDPYRAGLQIGRYAMHQNIHPLATYRWSSHELDFVLRQNVPVFQDHGPLMNWIHHKLNTGNPAVWLALPSTENLSLPALFKNNFLISEKKHYSYFRITCLNMAFLNPLTRPGVIDSIIVIKVRNGTP